ncbi:hypothetical protein Tcan_00964, partial [Toxocara canis]
MVLVLKCTNLKKNIPHKSVKFNCYSTEVRTAYANKTYKHYYWQQQRLLHVPSIHSIFASKKFDNIDSFNPFHIIDRRSPRWICTKSINNGQHRSNKSSNFHLHE